MCFLLCKSELCFFSFWNVFFPFIPLNFPKYTPAVIGREWSKVYGSANIGVHHTTWALPGFLINPL